jgi:hypothetical protein
MGAPGSESRPAFRALARRDIAVPLGIDNIPAFFQRTQTGRLHIKFPFPKVRPAFSVPLCIDADRAYSVNARSLKRQSCFSFDCLSCRHLDSGVEILTGS